VPYLVLRDEVVEGLVVLDIGDEIVNRRLVSIGQHDRLSVRLLRKDVARPIFFLRRPCLLVLHEGPVVVLGHRHAPEDPCLLPSVHHEPVHINGRLALLKGIIGLHELAQVDRALLVHCIVVFIHAGGQVNFGPDDVQEAARLSLCSCLGLRTVDHVVRDGRDFLDVLRERAHGPKGMQSGHRMGEIGDGCEPARSSIRASLRRRTSPVPHRKFIQLHNASPIPERTAWSALGGRCPLWRLEFLHSA